MSRFLYAIMKEGVSWDRDKAFCDSLHYHFPESGSLPATADKWFVLWFGKSFTPGGRPATTLPI